MTICSLGRVGGAVMAAAALALTGCSSGPGTASGAGTPGDLPTTATSAPDAPAATGDPAAGDPAAASPSPTEPGPESLGTVAPRVRRTLPPARKAAPVVVGASARASLVGSRRVTVNGQGPGEVGGPGVAVTLAVTNPSGRRLDLGAVAVTAETGGQAVEPSAAAPARPLSGSLAAGATVRGVYVFVLPPGAEGPLALEVSLSPDLPVATFTVR